MKRVCAAVAAAVLALSACSSSESAAAKTFGYPIAHLHRVGMRMARDGGDPHPRSIKVVRTRFLRASDLISGDTVNKAIEPDNAVWAIQIVGRFTCNNCSRPPGTSSPRGRVMHTIFNVGDENTRVFSLGRRTLALHELGHVADIT